MAGAWITGWWKTEGFLGWRSWLKAVEIKDKGGAWLLYVVFASFSIFEWVKTSLALCSHLYNLFLTSCSSLPHSCFPQDNWRWDQRGDGVEVKPTSGKSEPGCQTLCELRMTRYSLSVIIICLMVIYCLITFVFMVALTQHMLFCLTNFPLCFKTLPSQGRCSFSGLPRYCI